MSQNYYISEITIHGNKKTRPKVILREMRTQVGDSVSTDDLNYDARRVESLGLFSRVEFLLEEKDEGTALLIDVTEQWYLFPWPLFYFNDREYKWDKASYGMSLLHTNFRGNAEMLSIAGWLGYNPGAYLLYSIPAIKGNKNYFLSTQFFYYRLRSKSFELLQEEIDEKQVGGSIALGYRINLENSVQLAAGYSRIKYDPPLMGQTLHPAGRDNLPTLSLTYIRNTRDLAWYPSRGSFLSATYQKIGFWNDAYIDYRQILIESRVYRSIYKDVILAGRASLLLSDGQIPPYGRAYFGYIYRIRGRFSERYEGENRILSSLELRFPILPVRYFQIEESTLGNYGRNLKFGISGSLFLDLGSLWIQEANVDLYRDRVFAISSGAFGIQTRPDKWLHGFGAGLNFHVPYVNIIRFELGFNQDFDTEFIFDAQVAF
ncbi:MAG: BamA/TamA family outer membrane protein [Deferribacteres bacterium]|nr:BamA/TamA family outer membrane protein [candidate division KSB1 bacterium]MCB9504033.1 BamA/TamA family outer membrane protein [Deferribacteres bacterium]